MASGTWTPVGVVRWATGYLEDRGVPSPRLDAELLVAHVIGCDRLGIYLQHDRPLIPSELSALRDLIRRRAERVPLAYLTGWREFYRHRFRVTPDVLIPRPETEHLVEAALGFLAGVPVGERTVLDLGTGTGCIALSVAAGLPCRVWATDVSGKALAVARDNADSQGCRFVEFREGDWFDALRAEDPRRFRLILCNPPYVLPAEKAELEPELLQEPSGALFAGTTGWEAYESIGMGLKARMEEDGKVLLELHAKHADKIAGIFKDHGLRVERIIPDLRGLPRVLVLTP